MKAHVSNMKIVELDSILNGSRDLPTMICMTNSAWSHLKNYFDDLGGYRNRGERAVLNMNLPEEFVQIVLKEAKLSCFKTKDGKYFRSIRGGSDDEEISAVDVYLAYGGCILEQIYERGVVPVP
jgi:hypothetical protein